jgi:hypothetical protein
MDDLKMPKKGEWSYYLHTCVHCTLGQHVDILQTQWLLKIVAYGLSQKTIPFSCKEHIPSSKNEEMARFLKFPKENLSAF